MFAKFTAGSFTTNFFPDRGLAYITAQVRGWTACAKSIITAAVAAAIRIGATVETVVGFVLMPADMCQIPGAQRQLPQCARG